MINMPYLFTHVKENLTVAMLTGVNAPAGGEPGPNGGEEDSPTRPSEHPRVPSLTHARERGNGLQSDSPDPAPWPIALPYPPRFPRPYRG